MYDAEATHVKSHVSLQEREGVALGRHAVTCIKEYYSLTPHRIGGLRAHLIQLSAGTPHSHDGGCFSSGPE